MSDFRGVRFPCQDWFTAPNNDYVEFDHGYGQDGISVTVVQLNDDGVAREADAVLSRTQLAELVNRLQEWLGTPGEVTALWTDL